jgi:GT2 family glycosyltransferase
MNRVAVIILNYKGIEDTSDCLASLQAQTYQDFTTVVIENGSHDGSAEALKILASHYKSEIHVIYNDENLGFTGGVNTGLRWAIEQGFDCAALFNNDAVADKNWLKELVKAHDQEGSGITTGLLLHQDGATIDSTGDWYSIWGLPFPRGRDTKTTTAPKAGYVFSGSGGASLYSIKMLKQIGLFDETFFAYYEDVDVAFRAQLAGWKVFYTSKAIAYHKQGATSDKMPGFATYQTFKNLPLLYIKNTPAGLLLPIGVRFWFAYIIMLGHAIKRGSGLAALSGCLKGMALFWMHALPSRHRIQSTRNVSTAYIADLLWPDLPPNQTGLRRLRNFFTGKK